MIKLSVAEKNQVSQLYAGGCSLSQVSDVLEKPKTTVYYHIRKEFGRRLKPAYFNIQSEEDLGEFLGAFIGDGNFYLDKKDYNYRVTFYFSVAEKDYADRISSIIQNIFGKTPRVWTDERKKITYVRICSKLIYLTLRKYVYWKGNKTHTICLKQSSLSMCDSFLKGVIRGLIATDGSVYLPKRRVAFGTVSKNLCFQVSDILKNFGIRHGIYPVKYKGKKTLYHIHITGEENLLKIHELGLTETMRKSKLNQILKRQ